MTSSTVSIQDVRSNRHTMRVPRSRGAFSGLLLIVLGAWGALVPFIGPYFDFAYRSDETWVWTSARFWLEVLPGAVVVLGGLMLLMSVNRFAGSIGGWLAAAGGAWFIVGTTLADTLDIGTVGDPQNTSKGGRALETLAYFNGLGAVILLLAAFALGRLAVVGLRDVRAAEAHENALIAQREADERAAETRVAERRAAEEQAATDRAEAERVEAERVEADRATAERATADRATADRAEAERAEADRSAADRSAADRSAAERAEFDRQRERDVQANPVNEFPDSRPPR
jgi:hypothetical protein